MSYKHIIVKLNTEISHINRILNETDDEVSKKSLLEKKMECELEIRRVARLQWEEEHERVRLDDDR
jgi:hypothetical protein